MGTRQDYGPQRRTRTRREKHVEFAVASAIFSVIHACVGYLRASGLGDRVSGIRWAMAGLLDLEAWHKGLDLKSQLDNLTKPMPKEDTAQKIGVALARMRPQRARTETQPSTPVV